MSDQKIVELRSGKLKNPTIELPKFNCVKCGAENTLSEALTAGLMDEMSLVAQDKAARQFEEKLIIERGFQREARETSHKLVSEKLEPMTKELAELNAIRTQLEIAKAKTDAENTALQQTMEAQIEVAAKKAVERAKAEFDLTDREKEEEIDRLKKSIETLKSNSNPGSSQLAGDLESC